MELVASDACITGLVKVTNEAIHQVEKSIFAWGVVFAVEPVNVVAPNFCIVVHGFIVARTGR